MSRINTQTGQPIVAGYPWRLNIQTPNYAAFPQGVQLLAQFRSDITSADVIAEITTAAGILRVSDEEIAITLTRAQTRLMAVGSVEVDFVRTDLPEPQYLQIRLTIPVRAAVTRIA